jgi:UDP-2,3-diacylglucosamine pyrophosphatase LpxH
VLSHYKTIVISDVPLGTDRRNLKKLIYFLKKNTCDRLILSGDFIKGWQISTIKKIYKRQALFLNALFKLIEKNGTEIIFITGQNEMVKNKELFVKFGNFSFHKEYILNSGTYKYKVINGDILNGVAMAKLFPKLKLLPYVTCLFLNKKYNEQRFNKGFSYRSILKNNLFRKAEGLFVNNIRKDLIKIALADHCDGIICGNNHRPCIQQFGIVSYLNAGFWSESNMGLVESNTGNWKLLGYEETIEADKEARKFYRMQKRLMEQHPDDEMPQPMKAKMA